MTVPTTRKWVFFNLQLVVSLWHLGNTGRVSCGGVDQTVDCTRSVHWVTNSSVCVCHSWRWMRSPMTMGCRLVLWLWVWTATVLVVSSQGKQDASSFSSSSVSRPPSPSSVSRALSTFLFLFCVPSFFFFFLFCVLKSGVFVTQGSFQFYSHRKKIRIWTWVHGCVICVLPTKTRVAVVWRPGFVSQHWGHCLVPSLRTARNGW